MLRDRSLWRFLKTNYLPALFLLVLVVSTLTLFITSSYFQVKKIEIEAATERKKILGLENFYQKNILFISEKNASDKLVNANADIKSLTIEKSFPNKLKVHVQFEKGSATLAVDQGYFVLSPSARILSKGRKKPTGFPLINYYQKLHYIDYQTGDFVNLKDITTTLHFLSKTKELGLRVLSVDISGFNMIRLQLENKMIFFTTEKSLQAQDYELEVLIRQFKVEGKDFKTLDFRFEKPIVTLR